MCNSVHGIKCSLCNITVLTSDDSEHLCADCRVLTNNVNDMTTCSYCGELFIDATNNEYMCPECIKFMEYAIDDKNDINNAAEVLSLSQLEDMIEVMLSVRKDEVLTDEIILERARNIASALRGYKIEE